MQVRDRVLDLRRVKASDLRANPKNWRRHPQTQAVALRSVLEKVGYAGALLARETPEGLELIDGHLRQEISGSQEVPVLVVDLDDAEADLILATLDPLGAMAQTDEQALYDLLQGVIVPDDVLARALEEMTGQAGPPAVMGDPDAIPDLPTEPSTKPGDLYRLGEHRLLCGDSTDAGTVARLMDGDRSECMWTDPPYGVAYVGKTADALTIKNDRAEDLPELLMGFMKVAESEALAPGAAFYIARPPGGLSLDFGDAVRAMAWRLHEELQWVKDSMVLGHSDYHLRHETILFGYLPGTGRFGRGGKGWYGDDSQTSVFEVARPKASPDHPTGKPVDLIVPMLQNSSQRTVYEPFGGSGSTLIAAETTGRRAYVVEIDPAYCDVIVARWETFTGQSAERAA